MPSVKIFADSTCDLTKEQVQGNDIAIIPLYVVMDGRSYRDGIDVTSADIYRYAEKTKQTPTTAAASENDFIQAFTPYADAGTDIVYICIPDVLSASMGNALIAAKSITGSRIFVVDSRAVSTGTGLTVLAAAQWARQGLDAADIARKAERATQLQRTSFIIDSLTYLYRGGRCTALQAMGVNMLNITPEIIATPEGKLTVGRKFRGSLLRSARRYVADIINHLDDIDPKRIFITHSPCEEGVVEHVRAALEATGYFEEIYETDVGCVIGSHCGPNAVGVLYCLKDKKGGA